MDREVSTAIIFFDVNKAFDTVPNLPLLRMLALILSGNGFTAIYPVENNMLLSMHGAKSSVLPVVSGVPQGSVLSPLLFLVYVLMIYLSYSFKWKTGYIIMLMT